MKKTMVLIGTALVLALLLAGCRQPGIDDDNGGDSNGGDNGGNNGGLVVPVARPSPADAIFDLAWDTHFQALQIGETRPGQIFDFINFQYAGSGSGFEIIRGGGRNLIQVTVVEHWEGVDALDTGFNFQAGDIMRVAGIALTDNRMQLLTPGTWVYFGQHNVSAGQYFEFEHTLTADNVANAIRHDYGDHPNGIRVSGNVAGARFIITEMTVRRPVSSQPSIHIERVMLENGAYAIFRFDLPAGTTWADFEKITAYFRVDAENMARPVRHWRLMGAYAEGDFVLLGEYRIAYLWTYFNAPYIMDNTGRTFVNMGVSAGEWFSVTYDISGASAHEQFSATNIPAPGATGPFLFGIGISGGDHGAGGITQYIGDVTLHHRTNPALNVVSRGSGFAEPAFASFQPVQSTREVVHICLR